MTEILGLKHKMPITVLCLFLLLGGCSTCKKCYGQTGPLADNANIVTVTKYNEFRSLVINVGNRSLSDLADILFVIATNSHPPTSATAPVTINTAQNNRWFTLQSQSSFATGAYFYLMKQSANKSYRLTQSVLDNLSYVTDLKITNPAKKTRFINKVEAANSPSEEY